MYYHIYMYIKRNCGHVNKIEHTVVCRFPCHCVHVASYSLSTGESMEEGYGEEDCGQRVFNLPRQDIGPSTFKIKYNRTQKQLESIAAMDDLFVRYLQCTCTCNVL